MKNEFQAEQQENNDEMFCVLSNQNLFILYAKNRRNEKRQEKFLFSECIFLHSFPQTVETFEAQKIEWNRFAL